MLDPAIDEEDENLTALLNRVSSQSTPAAAAEEMRKPLSRVGVSPPDDTKAIRLASADRRAAQQSDATTSLLGDIGNASTSLLEGLTLTKLDRPKPMQPQAEARMVGEVQDEQQRANADRLMALRELEAEARGRPKPIATKTPQELAAIEANSAAKLQNAATYKMRTENDAAIARERMAAKAKAQAAAGAAKAAKDAAKSSAPTKGLAAGYELTGETNPVTTELTKHQQLITSAEKMKGLTSQMRNLLANSTTAERLNPFGEKRNSLKQLATMIAIEGKNIAELGALSGPDYALMNAIAADPTAAISMTKNLPGLLDQLDAWGANSVAAKSKALGVRPKGATPAPSVAAPTPTAAPKFILMVGADGDSVMVEPGDVEEFRANGYKER